MYGPHAALDRIDLLVREGECVLLLGPNGAGKSTLLRILSTLARPTSGSLLIHGDDPVRADRLAVRRRIGLLSHQTYLYENLSAAENLEFYAQLYGLRDPRGAAREGLASAGLTDRAPDLVCTFSRGMKQRLAIARALMHRPDVLLLDEPFSGLDREARSLLTEQLRQARADGRTCVLATHDFGAGAPIADRLLVLASGRLVLDRSMAGLDRAGLEAVFREATGNGTAGMR
jgi:heme exporter protein A